jgi:hypothetical protein
LSRGVWRTGNVCGVGGPEAALETLAGLLRDEETVVSAHVVEPAARPALGELAASGPRAAEARAEYALLFEAIREGYLLHYGEPRLIDGADPNLRLLTGDYLYALGLERLAERGDLAAVRELADLISLCAQLHAAAEGAGEPAAVPALWLASAVTVAAGGDEGHERGKAGMRSGDPEAADQLLASAHRAADREGIGAALAAAADSIGFAAQDLADRG